MTKRKLFNKDVVLNIIIIVLCVILFGLIAIYTAVYIDSNQLYVSDEHSLLYRVYYQKYNDLVDNVYRNEISETPVKGDMAEIYAVAHFYENAVLYYAHQIAGNTAQSEMRYERMQKYSGNMGEYADEADNILEYLEEKAAQ
ncbi:MAG: hypothetical protein HDR03_14035 [Lachnospiraceae bacterium]|nr:hypothetical protein [Lachnospiraceae bacterium]